MPKKVKLSLNDLRVTSFATSTLKGGGESVGIGNTPSGGGTCGVGLNGGCTNGCNDGGSEQSNGTGHEVCCPTPQIDVGDPEIP